jgi:hypothetical protein
MADARFEMPVIARLTKEELAAAMGKPVDHPDVELLGGLTVVIHPSSSPHLPSPEDADAALTGAAGAYAELREILSGVEGELFNHLRSSPAAAKAFLNDPTGTIAALGVLDPEVRARLESRASAAHAARTAAA